MTVMEERVKGRPDDAVPEGVTPADIVELVDSLNEQGRAIMRSDTKRALQIIARARELAVAHAYEYGLAVSLRDSSDCYYLLGDFKNGLDDGLEALNFFEALGDRRGMANALNALGKSYESLGEHSKAIEALSRGLEVCEGTGHESEVSRLVNNLGVTYFNLSDYPKALDCLQRSLSLKTKLGDLERLPSTLSNIGAIHEQLGEYRRAADYYAEALRKSRETNSTHYEIVLIAANLGMAYLLLGDHASALACLLEAVEMGQRTGHQYPEATAHIYLGKLHQKKGEFAEASASYRRGLEVTRRIGYRLLEGEALVGLGELYCEHEKYREAVEFLTEALTVAEQTQNSEQTFRTHFALSQVYERLGDFQRALDHHKSFYDARQKVFGQEADNKLKQVMVKAEVERAQREAEIHRLKHVELANLNAELEKAARSKSEFLANMSHEVRTPLNAVIGMAGLLLDTELTHEQQQLVEGVNASSDALLAIVNDILDLSKIESGLLDLESRPFDLRDCVEEALDLFAVKVAEKGLDLAYTVDGVVPPVIIGDDTRLRQVLVNLTANAVKFTPSGEVIISVNARPLTGNRHELHFAVRDTGIGIPANHLDRLFKPFSQVDNTIARRYGGTGLGLTISRRLSELMGGRLWVESAPGDGSTFHFTIAAEAGTAAPRPYLQKDQPQLAGRRLLIADDCESQRRIITRQAESWGMVVWSARSTAGALSLLEAGPGFDAALIDAHMPVPGSNDLLGEMRQIPQAKTLPVVLMSAIGYQETGTSVEGNGYTAYLTRPIKISHLYEGLIGAVSGLPGRAGQSTTRRQIEQDLGQRLPLRILLADDNMINRQVALRMLARLGYCADVAADGAEALEAMRRRRYDLLLTDIQMPEIDGIEVARRLVREWGAERPGIIAMTAEAMRGDRERCLEAGMDDYIPKPVRIEVLQAALIRWATRRDGLTHPVPCATTEAQPEGSAAQVSSASADLSSLLELRGLQAAGDADIVGELIELFLRETPSRLAAMRRAWGDADAHSLGRSAHTLQGSCLTVGARRMASLCAELEAGAQNGGALLAQLEEEYERFKQELEAFVAAETRQL